TVNPTAQVNVIANEVVCNTEATTVLFTTDNTVGVTGYAWTSDIEIGAGLTGAGDMSFTAANEGTDPLVATIIVTPTFTNEGVSCDGPTESFTITVNPTAQIDVITSQVLCNNELTELVAFTTQNTNGDTSYTWINDTPSIGLASNGSGDITSFIATNLGTEPLVATITVTPLFSNEGTDCNTGASETFTITVNPTPEIDLISDQTICSRYPFDDVAISTPTSPLGSFTYSWEVTTAGPNLSGFTTASVGELPISTPIIGETIFNTNSVAEDLVYSLTPFFNGCPGNTQTFTITVDPTPEIFAMSETICSEDTFDVLPINGDPTAATIVPLGTTYTWSVLSSPEVTGASDEVIPQNSVNITTALINSSNIDQEVIYTVTPTSDQGCVGPTFELTITIEPRPIILDKTDAICSGDTFTLSPTNNAPVEIVPANTLYSWVIQSPNTDLTFLTGYSAETDQPLISQTLINTSDEVKTITYIIIPNTGNCEGLPFELEVAVSPGPFVEDIVLDPICSEDTFVVAPITGIPNNNIVVPAGTTYTWTVSANPDLTGQGAQTVPQSTISQTLINGTSVVQTVIYTVTPLSAGCQGPSFDIVVTVKPRPSILSGSDTQNTQCSGNPFMVLPQDGVPTVTTLVPVGTTYTWEILTDNSSLLGQTLIQNVPQNEISETLINTTNINQQITYVVTPEADGCIGDLFEVVITIQPIPVIPDLVQVLCDEENYILSPVNGVLPDAFTIVPDTTLYTWGAPVLSNPNITGWTTGTDEAFFDTGILENGTTVIQTVTFTVTPNYYTTSNPATPQCVGEDFTVTISLKPSPEINEVIANIACSYSDPLCGASIDISPIGLAPFTYSWTSVEGNPIADPSAEDLVDLCPGTYELAITDNTGCTYLYDYEIIPPTPVEFTLVTLSGISCNNVNDPPCDGFIEMSLSGGTLPYASIEWFGETAPGSEIFTVGPFTNTANPLQLLNACEGRYHLEVIDTNGCQFISDPYIIEQINTPIILSDTVSNFNGFNIDCNGANTGSISVDLDGGSGTYNYSLADDSTLPNIIFAGTLNSSPATVTFDFLIAGNYTLTVTDPICPFDIVVPYTLTQPDPLIMIATLTDPISCFGGLATYDLTATGGVPPYTGTGLIQVSSGSVTFTVFDSNGCSDAFTTTVTEPTELTSTSLVTNALCFGDLGLVEITPNGGEGVLTVSLFDATNIFMSSQITTPGIAVQFNELAGTYFYTVEDANGCETNPIVVAIDEPLLLEVTSVVVTDPDCNSTPAWAFDNGSICITIIGGTNPFPVGAGWIDNGGGNWCLTALSAGTYPIDVTDINGCPLFTIIQDVILTRPPQITAFFRDTLEIDCASDTATQTNFIFVNGGVPPYEITWSGGVWDPLTQELMETSVGGNYTAFVNDQYGIANGCPPIAFPLEPIVFFEFGISDFTLSSSNSSFCGVYSINDPVNFQNTSIGDIVNFTWNFGDGSPLVSGVDAPSHIYDTLGTYTIELTVEDNYGCLDTFSETIEVTKGYEIILPTAFTPNFDGINETIRP
ncbi:MAG: PKD-like domain-containing protein, partial [Methylophagaceae bacterium]